LERREEQRDNRSKNTLVWRELALIAALGVVILAFKLNLGNPQGNRDVAAQPTDDIVLRDVRVTPPEPEPPEPEPEPKRRPKPKPEVPKEMPRKEVPDEEIEEEPEVVDEPTPEPMERLETAPVEAAPEPAPAPSPPPTPAPEPEPPPNKVFNQGTVDRNAEMKGRIEVEYPSSAKRAGIEGRVILQFVVDESGRPQAIEVLRSPSDMLSEAAVDALEKKSFKPAMQNGQPVKMRMSQPVTFRLR
jgi:protein TonB